MIANMFGRFGVMRGVLLTVEEPRKVSTIAAGIEVCSLLAWLVLLSVQLGRHLESAME